MKSRILGFLFLLLFPIYIGAVTLTWEPTSSYGIDSYKIHYGLNSGQYSHVVDVGFFNEYILDNAQFVPGTQWYFAVTTYNSWGFESDPSNEVTWFFSNNHLYLQGNLYLGGNLRLE